MPAQKKRSKKSGATRNSEAKSSGLSWMLMGLLVGLFVAFLVYLDKIPLKNGADPSSQEQSSKTPRTTDQKPSKPKEHQFDFYTVLPDQEVEIVDVEEAAETTASKVKADKKISTSQQKSQSTAQSTSLYQLQVGAFKDLKKADAMKARLAFLGVESNIQVFHASGQKMYRVRVGPSTDGQKINQIKAQLKSQNINTFVQKL